MTSYNKHQRSLGNRTTVIKHQDTTSSWWWWRGQLKAFLQERIFKWERDQQGKHLILLILSVCNIPRATQTVSCALRIGSPKISFYNNSKGRKYDKQENWQAMRMKNTPHLSIILNFGGRGRRPGDILRWVSRDYGGRLALVSLLPSFHYWRKRSGKSEASCEMSTSRENREGR